MAFSGLLEAGLAFFGLVEAALAFAEEVSEVVGDVPSTSDTILALEGTLFAFVGALLAFADGGFAVSEPLLAFLGTFLAFIGETALVGIGWAFAEEVSDSARVVLDLVDALRVFAEVALVPLEIIRSFSFWSTHQNRQACYQQLPEFFVKLFYSI